MPQPMKVKKVPLRKCVVTNEQHPKMEMFRIVRTPENQVVIDLGGKVKGHGAYVCKKKSVIQMAMKKKILNRHLEVEVPDTIFEELLKQLEEEK
ncbi:MAG: YlxR family protein [Anaeroplasma bactoclasticum]|nr:YlxR family protein [Anaeroplasma bactoclasticum]